RARSLPAPLPDDVLHESIRRILDNPVVRNTAAFLKVAAIGGVPQVGERMPRKLMSLVESRNIALALGEYALGRLSAVHPVHQRLREAVDEAFALLPRIPPEGQQAHRDIFEAAWSALAVLADPAQTPPELRWASEIVAMDGARVLVDEVSLARVRDPEDPEGRPVGVASLQDGDWWGDHT
ncbi:hypothetical protein, partial [Streptomyces iranensis]